MASLFSLMPAGAGPIPLERLEAAAEDEDVPVDCLIDEELYWLRGPGTPDPVYDEPYLSTLTGEARDSAIDSGMRSLIAKGMIDLDPEDGESIEILGAYALLAQCRRESRWVTRAVLEVPDEPTVRFVFHRISDALVLVEEVSDDGFHDFTFQSHDSAAGTLSSAFDRRRSAGSDSGPHVHASEPSALDPSPESLRATSVHVVSVIGDGVTSGGERHEITLTVYGQADAVWAQWVEPGMQLVVARTGAPDLYVLAADAIAGRAPGH